MKRKLEKGDREETLETKAELPKKKIRPNLKSDLMEKLDAQNSKLMDQMETQHRDKLQRMDRRFVRKIIGQKVTIVISYQSRHMIVRLFFLMSEYRYILIHIN